jgi:hypothetical protein
MEDDNSLTAQIKKVFDQVKVYLDLKVGYLKLQVAEYLIRFFSSLVLWMVLFFILFFVIVFGSFAFAYWFGELTGRWSLGFLIIAGFYILLAVIIYTLRKSIIVKPFTSLILHQMELDQFNDTEDEKK